MGEEITPQSSLKTEAPPTTEKPIKTDVPAPPLTEKKPEGETAPKLPDSPVDLLARIARQDKAHRDAVAAAKAEQEKLLSKISELEKAQAALESIKKDPLAGLKSLGIEATTESEIRGTLKAAKDAGATPDALKLLEQKLTDLAKRQDELAALEESRKQADIASKVAAYRSDIDKVIKSEFPLIEMSGRSDDVFELANLIAETEKRVPTPKEAAQRVQDYLVEHYSTLLDRKEFHETLKSSKAKKAAPQGGATPAPTTEPEPTTDPAARLLALAKERSRRSGVDDLRTENDPGATPDGPKSPEELRREMKRALIAAGRT